MSSLRRGVNCQLMKSSPHKEAEGRTQSVLKLVAAGLLAVGAIWFVVAQFRPPKVKINTKAFESLGTLAADESAKLLGSGGKILLVSSVPGPTMSETDPLAQSLATLVPQLAAFKSRLQKLGKFEFLPELKLPQPVGAQSTVWSAGKFSELVAQTPPDAALVLFCFLPASISDAERQTLRQRPGKVILAGVMEYEARPFVQEKLVHLAIAARTPVPPKTSASESPNEWVRRVYVVINSAQP